ncbi:MAG: hypothetical protein ACPGN3_05250 [Opitutales bacterium]
MDENRPTLFRFDSANNRGSPVIEHVKTLDPKLSNLDSIEEGLEVENLFHLIESPQITIGETGTEWTDIIGGRHHDLVPFILKENVVDCLLKNNCSGFEASEIEIIEVHSKKLRKINRPRYFYLKIKGALALETKIYGETDRFGRSDYTRSVPVNVSNLNEDLMRGEGKSSLRMCSYKIIQLAHQNKWSNFSFEPLDSVKAKVSMRKARPVIDYLSKRFPPKVWYPEYHYEIINNQ